MPTISRAMDSRRVAMVHQRWRGLGLLVNLGSPLWISTYSIFCTTIAGTAGKIVNQAVFVLQFSFVCFCPFFWRELCAKLKVFFYYQKASESQWSEQLQAHPQSKQKFYGLSHYAPTPSITTIQQLGLGIAHAFSIYILSLNLVST